MNAQRHIMKLHPWDEVLENANNHIANGADVYQQFNCEHCGAKQTMDKPNTFYMSGICEECRHETNIKLNGMNFMVHRNFVRSADGKS